MIVFRLKMGVLEKEEEKRGREDEGDEEVMADSSVAKRERYEPIRLTSPERKMFVTNGTPTLNRSLAT